METFFPILVIFIFGAIIGSFLNVVILRLHTGKSLNGRSHCMTCGAQLGALELIPILSYIALLGKCKSCSAQFSIRYASIEILTGFAFVLAYLTSYDAITFLAKLLLLSVLVLILVYDLDHLIIPDELVVILFVPAVVLMFWNGTGIAFNYTDILAPILASGLFYGLWKVSGGRWIGLGDAKLTAPLSLAVGFSQVFSFVVAAFWIGAVVSVVLLAFQKLQKRRGQKRLRFLGETLTMKSEIPFAPFLIISFVLVFFFSFSAFDLTETLISYVI